MNAINDLTESQIRLLMLIVAYDGWYVDTENLVDCAALITRGFAKAEPGDHTGPILEATTSGTDLARSLGLVEPALPGNNFGHVWQLTARGIALS